jgi:hypothetical protein
MILIFFHLLTPSKLLGFVLGVATVIGWYKSLLRLLMLRCMVSLCMRPRSLISWCLIIGSLIPWSLELGRRSSAMISLLGHIFLGLGFLSLQEGALRTNMPTYTTVMAYGRSSNEMRLLSAWNIIVDLVLPFIFNNGRRLWDCRFHKYSL